MSEWQSRNESVRGTSVVEENRGSRRQEFVTIEVQGIAPLLDLGGADRTQRQWSTVQEKATNQGWSRRKLPREKSLRPRNSSGSLTS
jgi:hypothetical protein